MEEHKKYPLGIHTFSEIAKGNYYYADKTAFHQSLFERVELFAKSIYVLFEQAIQAQSNRLLQ